MIKLHVDPELRDLIPPLSEQEYLDLQEDIGRRGIEVPLKYAVLNGKPTLVDGHHRYKIAQALGIEAPLREFEFLRAHPDDEEAKLREVKMWMIQNVINHRNVERFELVRLVYLKNRIMFWQMSKDAMSEGGKVSPNEETLSQTRDDAQKHKMVAGFSGVSESTCERAIFIIDVANGWNRAGAKYASRQEEAAALIEQLRDKSSEMSISKAYARLHRPLDESEDSLKVAVPEERAVERLSKMADEITAMPYDSVATRASHRPPDEALDLVRKARLVSDWWGHFADTLDERTQVTNHRPSEGVAA